MPRGSPRCGTAADSVAGATLVTVTLGPASGGEAWVLELSGARTGAPLDVVAIANDQNVDTIAQARPVPTTAPHEIVFSIVNITANVSGIAPGDPFVPLAVTNGDDSAYLIATTPGSYGAAWTLVQQTPVDCASSAAFFSAP